MAHEIGIQWQRETKAVLDYNLMLPTVLKAINCHTREFLQQLRNDNPNALLIYRHYPNYDDWRDYPEQCARDAVGVIKAELVGVLNLFNFVEDNNEWVFPFFSDVEIDAADRYMSTFIETAWQETGLHTVFLNSACGNWGDDVVRFWRTLEAAAQYGAMLGQHEYDWPTMDRIFRESGDYWLCGKWQKSMAAIKAAGYKNIKCIITEAGIDGGVADQPMKGWKSVPNALENYCASLLWYNDLLIADGDVPGCALFIMSGEGMWSDFDIADTEVPNRIAQFPTVPPPEPPPEPPNGGDPVVDIYDFDGNKRDWDWLRQNFGDIKIHPIEDIYQPKDGDRVYKVSYLRARTGYAATLINVRDKQGKPVVGETVIFGWRTAEPHGYSDRDWNWTENGAAGDTNSTGDVGPGMSKDGYYAPPGGGPYWCWVWDLPSEKVTGLGMIAGTFHDHIDVGYEEEIYGDGEPPPPEPPTDWEKNIERILSKVARIVEILEVAPPPPEPPIDQPFAGEYFNNVDLSGTPVFTRADLVIDFEWGAGSPDPRINPDHFSVRWTGKRTFEARPYTFYALVDDGIHLYVDGVSVLESWKDQAPTRHHATKMMTAGQHDIKVEYYERAGGATCKVWWE